MAKKRKNQNNPAARAMILLVAVGVPLLFVLASVGTRGLIERAPYLLLVLCAIVMGVYVGYTSGLLYQFYEVSRPWYCFTPCYGELALMDSKFLKIGSIFYVVAILFLGLSRIPFVVLKGLGENLAISFPFYCTVVAFIALAGVQVVKGFGLVDCMKTVSSEWEEHMNTSLGFIKSFCWLGFIPFVRVIAIYAINKPLSTLVTFNEITVSDTTDVELAEEEAEEY